MIPIKLQLKNFLSYGPQLQTIDFGKYPLICLSGKNGHGKSALLDAITWAIWGQARKTSNTAKADHGLLRLGQTQMVVLLEFECNGQLYRIRREFAISYGKSYASLDFGVFDTTKNRFIPLTDKTIRTTQKKIEQTINLDFETFTNSAFLRQGQANEFSQKSPKDRKEILATILGLDRYEKIKKRAMEKIRACNIEQKTIRALQEKVTQELTHKPTIEQQIKVCGTQYYQITAQEKKFLQQEHLLQKRKDILLEDKKNYELVQIKLQQITEKEQELQKQLRTVRDTWHTIHVKQLTYAQKPDPIQKKNKLLQEIKQHQERLHKGLQLKEQQLKQKEAIQHIEQTILTEHNKKVQQQQIQLERLLLEKKSVEAQYTTTEKEIAQQKKELTQYVQEITLLQKKLITQAKESEKQQQESKQFERRKEYYQQFIAQGNWVKQELATSQQKKKLAHNENAPSCPLCEQNLSATRKRFLKQKFNIHEQFLQHRLARLTKVINNLKTILFEQHKIIEQLKQQAQEQHEYQITIEQLEKTHAKLYQSLEMTHKQNKIYQEKIKQYVKNIAVTQQKLHETEKQYTLNLQGNKEYQLCMQQLTILENTLQKHAYDSVAHEKAQKQLQDVDNTLTEHAEFLRELNNQTERKQQIAHFCTQLRQIKKEKSSFEKDNNALQTIQKTEQQIKKEIETLTEQRTILAKQKEQLLQEKGRLENQQEKLTALEKEYKQQEQRYKTLQSTIDDYYAISTATGKDGIQALLIEDAIPEIEQEANNLLAKLTDNQAHIIIESLRDLKKGGTRETLDIKVSDNMGIRCYELFSGGESFRIDFALRIAISKLLARRAGTTLQTLIIDEGFGSQDEEGLARIMDAIYKVQDDFCKVIIVSHLSAMKEQFPVHLIVNKGPNGSQMKVIEQG